MTVHAPRGKNAFRESILTGSPDVIHDFIATIFDDRFPNSGGKIIEHFIPTDAFPFAFAAFSRALQRIKNAIRIVDLIERRRTFGAIASARSRILRIAFELLNLIRVFVDVGKQPARRLAVKTCRRD